MSDQKNRNEDEGKRDTESTEYQEIVKNKAIIAFMVGYFILAIVCTLHNFGLIHCHLNF